MKFCPKCNGLMVVLPENTKLIYECHVCHYQLPEIQPTDHQIYFFDNETGISEFPELNFDDLKYDMTYPRTHIPCKNKNCKNRSLIFVRGMTTFKMQLICVECNTAWFAD